MVLRDDTLNRRMDSEYQRTDDGSFAHESLISSYLALPALRGFWPMSSQDASGSVYDLSGQGHTLLNTGLALSLDNGIVLPTTYYQGGERLYATDAAWQDMLGTDSYVDTAYRGLTIGCWANKQFADAGSLIGKHDTAGNDRAYLLYSGTGGAPTFFVSDDGTNSFNETHTDDCDNDEWHFLVGRYSPFGTPKIDVWRNDDYETNSTSIPASLNNSAEDFEIGSHGGGTSYFQGWLSCAFVCAASLPDSAIRRLYYRTRPAFQSRALW